MLFVIHIRLSQSCEDFSLYKVCHIYGNLIGNEGLQHISKKDWKKLEYIDIGSCFTRIGLNKIDCEGVKFLPRIGWPSLKKLSICIYFNIEGETI